MSTRRFEPSESGSFMVYRRSQEPGTSKRKLCFTATDQAVLVKVLEDLIRRPDCWYAKYALVPRAGMFLGRCFFDDEETVGRMWARYKRHPELFCSIQDDDFAKRYRGP